ncbi:MAG TPA: DUF1223 domain-containing protein [Rhizomicrobium sp.]|nr:DUF1223 domain-containing protein [Rhizomicrobium sp.]
MTLVPKAFAGGLAATLVLCGFSAVAGQAKRPVVVELYTSQGCSSCVPADALLAKLTKRPDVLPMSLPVTYWDMLGWKDTLASETNTRRQKAYAAQMGQSAVYTPQIIVDGVSDVVGSREQAVETAIDTSARETWNDDVSIAMKENANALHIAIGGSADRSTAKQPATVWMFHLRGQATVAIGGGENDGRTMTYHNVVGDLKAVGQWKGEPLSIDLPRSGMEGLPHDAVVVVVQGGGGYGKVMGVAMLNHPAFAPIR